VESISDPRGEGSQRDDPHGGSLDDLGGLGSVRIIVLWR
jgi:hypothetical protein